MCESMTGIHNTTWLHIIIAIDSSRGDMANIHIILGYSIG